MLKKEKKMNEVRKKYKKLKEKKQSQQKAIEEAEVRITELVSRFAFPKILSTNARKYPAKSRVINRVKILRHKGSLFSDRVIILVVEINKIFHNFLINWYHQW